MGRETMGNTMGKTMETCGFDWEREPVKEIHVKEIMRIMRKRRWGREHVAEIVGEDTGGVCCRRVRLEVSRLARLARLAVKRERERERSCGGERRAGGSGAEGRARQYLWGRGERRPPLSWCATNTPSFTRVCPSLVRVGAREGSGTFLLR